MAVVVVVVVVVVARGLGRSRGRGRGGRRHRRRSPRRGRGEIVQPINKDVTLHLVLRKKIGLGGKDGEIHRGVG